MSAVAYPSASPSGVLQPRHQSLRHAAVHAAALQCSGPLAWVVKHAAAPWTCRWACPGHYGDVEWLTAAWYTWYMRAFVVLFFFFDGWGLPPGEHKSKRPTHGHKSVHGEPKSKTGLLLYLSPNAHCGRCLMRNQRQPQKPPNEESTQPKRNKGMARMRTG